MKKTIIKIAMAVITMMMVFGLSTATAEAYSSTCIASGCHNKTVSGSNYCSKHKCKKSGCGKKGYSKYSGYCSTNHKNACTSKSSTKKSSSSNYSTKKKSSTTKRTEMPDCDDYEDEDEFLDDWDGNMPDGSDAEDYWDNW